MSFISTYQGRKSLFAEKLITKGVEASGTDGLTTLINKISDIQSFNDGLFLYGDKIIAQSADTVNLYALLLDDKIPQSGETVKFYADKILVTDTASPGDSLYDDYYVTSEKTGSSWDYIGSGSTGFIQFNSEKINTYHSSWSGEVSHNGDKIHIKDGVLTYHDTSDVEQTIDVSAIDTTQAYNTAAFTVYYYWVEATTGSNGVANYQYTCTGAGKINFSAKSGGIQSEPYSIYDYINYDNGLDGDCSNIWTGNTEDLSRQSDGSLFSSTSARKLLSSALIHGDFEATFEAIRTGSPLWGVQDASSNMTRYYLRNDADFVYYKITREGSTITAKYSLNGTSWANLTQIQGSSVTSADCYFLLHNNSGTKSIKFKNVKIYPI